MPETYNSKMKWILCLCLLSVVLGEELHYFHYTGLLAINNDQGTSVNGPMFVELLKNNNFTIIAGNYKKGTDQTSFGFNSKITTFKKDGDKFELHGVCTEGMWGKKKFVTPQGKVVIEGTWDHAAYSGWCYDTQSKTNYSMAASCVFNKCMFYPPLEAAKRAQTLVGEKAEDYKAVHVLNYATIGYAYSNTLQNCKWYADNMQTVSKAGPGLVIVGHDASHCAIVDKEGHKFIHTHPEKKVVAITPLSQIQTYFKKGYDFKDYAC